MGGWSGIFSKRHHQANVIRTLVGKIFGWIIRLHSAKVGNLFLRG